MRKEELKKLGIYSPIFMFPYVEGEEWKPITERSVEGVTFGYSISNKGRVYSSKRSIPKFIDPVVSNNGYLRVPLGVIKNGVRMTRYYLVHRIVMIEFRYIENYKSMQVNHISGINSIIHLITLNGVHAKRI